MARNGDIEPEGDDAGKPYTWDTYVQEQLKRMRAPASVVQSYGGVQNESVEDQIARIEQLLSDQAPLLQEKDPYYDLRIYTIKIEAALQDNLGGESQDTQAEIRGIEGVTTVRPISTTKDVGTAQVATYDIRFELLGSMSRVKYRDRVLSPGMMKIKGLKILRVHPIGRIDNPGASSSLAEMSLPFGGRAAALGAVRYGTGPVRTPRSSVQQVADDWSSDGVMDYDRPMANADMQYHVMVNTEELFPYMSRVYRNPKDAFDSDYHHFIKNGPQMPVYVAVGKNGRVKITGNEDLVWFAKKSGLEEIPVFFSYQLQV
jgi:hypothetical protein